MIPSWLGTEEDLNNGIFFRAQAEELVKAGMQVVMLSPQIGGKTSKQAREITVNGVVYVYIDSFSIPILGRILNYLSFYLGLRNGYEYVEDHYGKPDVIHLQSTIFGSYGAGKLAETIAVPLVITEHKSSFIVNRVRFFDKIIIRKTMRKALMVTAVGSRLQKSLQSFNDCEIGLLPNFTDFNLFKLSERDVSNNEFVFFTVSNLVKGKNVKMIISAFSDYLEKKPNSVLKIAGDGPERVSLENYTQFLKIGERVEFLGKISHEEVALQMSDSDVYLLASNFETFSIVCLEAFASGKPVVATKCGGPEELVNQTNGLLVDLGDEVAFTNAMLLVTENLAYYNPESIREESFQKYSSEAFIKNIKKIYPTLNNKL